jgi:hypothetical protein
MANNAITCDNSCDAQSLTAVDPSYCNPTFLTGQIQRAHFTMLDGDANFGAYDSTEPLASDAVNNPAAWSARMDQTAVAAGAIITMPVIGSKALPEDEVAEFSQGRERVTARTHTLELEFDEHSDLMHDFWRKVTTCGLTCGMWYEIANGGTPYLASSHEGHHIPIEVSLKGGMEIPVERAGKVVWRITATWKTLGTETLMPSPVPDTPEPTT